MKRTTNQYYSSLRCGVGAIRVLLSGPSYIEMARSIELLSGIAENMVEETCALEL